MTRLNITLTIKIETTPTKQELIQEAFSVFQKETEKQSELLIDQLVAVLRTATTDQG